MAQVTATVVSVSGEVFARNAAGELRALKLGDVVFEGEVVVAAPGGVVELSGSDGSAMQVGGGQSMMVGEAVGGAAPAAGVEAALEAVEAGTDLEQALEAEAPAAGLAGGEAGDGSSFVRLVRISEGVTGVDYAYRFAPLAGLEPQPATPEVVEPEPAAPAPVAGVVTFAYIVLGADGQPLTAPGGGYVYLEGDSVVEGNRIGLLATVDVPPTGSALVLELSVGGSVTIPVGATTGFVELDVRPDDVFVQGEQPVEVTVTGGAGGEYDSLDVQNPGGFSVVDDDDAVTVTLSTTTTELDEGGGSVVYTVTLSGPAGASIAPDTDLTVRLANGELVTIEAGTLSGSVTRVYADADISTQAGIANEIAEIVSGGDQYENLLTAGNTLVDIDYGTAIAGVGAVGGDEVVAEASLPAGSSPDAAALRQGGSFSVSAPDGINTVQVGNQVLSYAALTALSPTTPVTVDTPYGTLLLTGFSGTSQGGTLSYEYVLDSAVNNDLQEGAGDESFMESVEVTLTDLDSDTSSASLGVVIGDDQPALAVGGIAMPNVAGSYEGVFAFNTGADTQTFAQSFADNALQWTNKPDDYGFALTAATADSKTYVATDSGGQPFFEVTVNSDGSYAFNLLNPAPVTETEVPGVLQGIEGGNKLEYFDFPSSKFDDYFTLRATGTTVKGGEVADSTITISATELGVGDNVMHPGDALKLDVVTSSTDVSLSGLFFSLEHAGVDADDQLALKVVYSEGEPDVLIRPVVADADGFTVSFSDNGTDGIDTTRLVDYVELTGVEDAQFKIDGLSLNYVVREYPDDYQLDFALSGSDLDSDEADAVFSVAVNTGDADGYSIDGTDADDMLYGTDGSDTLSGGGGADTYVWRLADIDDEEGPAVDIVKDFSVDDGDSLDLSDLLSGIDPDNLDNHLGIEHDGAGNTTLSISLAGDLDDAIDQVIILEGVELLDGDTDLDDLIDDGVIQVE